MKNRRQLQPVEGIDVETQRPRSQLQLFGEPDEMRERRALQGYAVIRAQRREVDAISMVSRHHRQTSEAALGGLGLEHQRGASARRPRQAAQRRTVRAHTLPVTVYSG